MEQYVRVSDLKEELACLAAEKFSVVDPRYQYLLEILETVEEIIDTRVYKYPEPRVRVGTWIREDLHNGSWRNHCSICGAKVYWPAHKGEVCRYASCPACRVRMEVEI